MILTPEMAEGIDARKREVTVRRIKAASSVTVKETAYLRTGTGYMLPNAVLPGHEIIVCHPKDRPWIDVWIATLRT